MNTVCPHTTIIFHSDIKQGLHVVPLSGTTTVFYTICYIVWIYIYIYWIRQTNHSHIYIYNVTIILSHWQYYESNIQQCPHPLVLFVNTVCYTTIVGRPTCYAVLSHCLVALFKLFYRYIIMWICFNFISDCTVRHANWNSIRGQSVTLWEESEKLHTVCSIQYMY